MEVAVVVCAIEEPGGGSIVPLTEWAYTHMPSKTSTRKHEKKEEKGNMNG
ncbi:MAG: hypothetical protein ACLFVP_09105 [Candidatus Bathyarchaeia archaeon]